MNILDLLTIEDFNKLEVLNYAIEIDKETHFISILKSKKKPLTSEYKLFKDNESFICSKDLYNTLMNIT